MLHYRLSIRMQLQLKYREILLAYNWFFIRPIVMKFSAGDGSGTAVLCAKSQNDWAIEIEVEYKDIWRNFNLGWVLEGFPILQQPGALSWKLTHGMVMNWVYPQRELNTYSDPWRRCEQNCNTCSLKLMPRSWITMIIFCHLLIK